MSFCLAFLLLLNAFGAVGCAGNPETETADYSALLDKSNLATEYGEDYTAYPRPEGEPEKIIQVLDMEGAGVSELFAAVALQGIVNRVNPSLYLTMNFWIEGNLTMNTSRYWLDALDQTYLEDGAPYYQKVYHERTDLAEVIGLYREKIAGAVLYDDRLDDRDFLAKREYHDQILGDMAAANLTAMAAGQLSALPMTQSQLAGVNAKLQTAGLEPLPVLEDTRPFMREGGTLEGELYPRDSLEIWNACYDYALERMDEGEWTFSDRITAHNGTLNLACYDYIIGNKMFVFNRQYRAHRGVFMNHATKPNGTPVPTQETVDRILDIAGTNTPVIGCWNLGDANGNDEEYCVQECNDHGKYFLVTVESWNLSWTSGLPRVSAQAEEEKLTYDPEKVYVSMTFSETDNNTYTNSKLPEIYENGRRGEYPVTWALNQACVDLNPNIIAYYNQTMKPGDGFATGEAGAGYINYARIPEDMRSDFLGLTDLYAERLGNGAIRTIHCDPYTAMDYIMYMDNITSVLSGYGGDSATFGHYAGTFDYLNGENNFYFRDVPVFKTIFPDASFSQPGLEGAGAPDILQELNAAPGSFFNIGLMGWTTSLDKIYDAMQKAPDNYVFVTENQLADLYRQKVSSQFCNVTSAEFTPDMNRNEMGFLFYSDQFENFSSDENGLTSAYRFGKDDNVVIYRFPFAEDAGNAVFDLSIGGDYKITLSTDLVNWTVAAQQRVPTTDYSEKHAVFDLPEEMRGKTVYLRITDSAGEDVGFRFYHLSMLAERAELDRSVTFDTRSDGAYYVSGGSVDEEGYRTGEVTYRMPMAEAFRGGQLTVEADGPTEISVSADGRNFYPVKVSETDRSAYRTAGYGNLYSAQLPGTSGSMYIRVKSDSRIRTVHCMGFETLEEFVFTPSGNDFDNNHLVSGWDVTREGSGKTPYARVNSADVLTYAFRLGAGNEFPILTVYASGRFTLEVSADGENWTVLKEVQSGEIVDSELSFNVSSVAKPNGTVYVRFRANLEGSAANLYYLKLAEYRM